LGRGPARPRGQRQRRQAESCQNLYLVVDDHFLCDALGRIRRSGIVLDDQFDRSAGDLVAVLRHVQACRSLYLFASRREGACHGQYQADFEFIVLCKDRVAAQRCDREGGDEGSFLHGVS